MADISIQKEHKLDSAVLRERLETLATSLKGKYGLSSNWDGNTCTLSGTGLKKATLVMADEKVSLDVSLGFAAKMLKKQIEKEIVQKMDDVLKV